MIKKLGTDDGSWKTYNTIAVGESEITTDNLYVEYYPQRSNNETYFNFTQEIIDKMNIQYEGKPNIDLATFLKINGSYISPFMLNILKNEYRVFESNNRE